MNDAYSIMRWSERHFPAVLGPLMAEAVSGGYGWMDELNAQWAARPMLDTGEALLIARRGGEAAAMAIISRDPFNDDGATGRLRFIFVSQSARRQGLAEALVLACLEQGRDWKRITLHTDNPAAEALYVRYGFCRVEGLPRVTHQRV